MSLDIIAGFGILGALVFLAIFLLVRRLRRAAMAEGAAEARRATLERDSAIIERQRDAATNPPDPHRPDDVLGGL